MKPSEIKAGATYRNKGKGRTWRKVQCISRCIEYEWYSMAKPPDEMGVQYVDNSGRVSSLCLSSFASWVGSEVVDGSQDTD